MKSLIRPAVAADVPAIVAGNRLLAEREGATLEPERLARGVANAVADPTKSLYFVAEEAGRVVGQVMVTYEWSDWRDGWVWWLQSVYVWPEWRGQGVFRALYERVEAEARAHGVVVLRLYVADDNDRAQAAYEAMGLRAVPFALREKVLLDA